MNFHGLFSLHTICLGKVPSKENKISFLLEKMQKLCLLHMDYALKLQYVPNFFSPAEHPKAVVKW